MEYDKHGPNLFHYVDFRRFLRDYYLYHKARNGLSYRKFSKKAGIVSPSFIKLAIEGKKNLSPVSINGLASAMELSPEQREYFTAIVEFGQSKTFEAKKKWLQRIDAYHRRNNPTRLTPHDFDYLKSWIHAPLREMVELPDFREDPAWIGSRLGFRVKRTAIEASLRFLLNHGFIERTPDGRLRKREKTLSTGTTDDNEVLSLIARAYHLQIADLTKEAIANLPKGSRNATNTTLSLSPKSYALAVERIRALRYELLQIAAGDEEADTVYQLSVNLFPYTKPTR